MVTRASSKLQQARKNYISTSEGFNTSAPYQEQLDLSYTKLGSGNYYQRKGRKDSDRRDIHLLKKTIFTVMHFGKGFLIGAAAIFIAWILSGSLLNFLSGSPGNSGEIITMEMLGIKDNQSLPLDNHTDTVLGLPTITAEKIDSVLKSYNSPAQGTGQIFYNLGLKYDIDPAYALAFFIHESSAGTQGVAKVTKSIGNIRATVGYDSYQGFRKYSSWESGIEDWYKLIKELYIDGWKLSKVENIIPVYAPVEDNNDTRAYIQQVNNLVASWRNGY